jgi:hypothetical protein
MEEEGKEEKEEKNEGFPRPGGNKHVRKTYFCTKKP